MDELGKKLRTTITLEFFLLLEFKSKSSLLSDNANAKLKCVSKLYFSTLQLLPITILAVVGKIISATSLKQT